MSKTFLYGIGATKAGTTWLARALRAHPQVKMPPIKETHYFDSIESQNSMWAMDQITRVRADNRASLAACKDEEEKNRLRRSISEVDLWLGLIGSQRQHDKRYAELIMRNTGKKHRLVADVTPAYSMLKRATYRRMSALNGGDTKFVMVLRDPVDRIWSNIGMTLGLQNITGSRATKARKAKIEEVLQGADDTPEMLRSDYARTLKRLYAVVPPEKVHVMFYEELFEEKTLTDLTAFLGLEGTLAGPQERVNAGTGTKISEKERAALAHRLRTQYEDTLSRMGRLPPRWQDTLNLTLEAT